MGIKLYRILTLSFIATPAWATQGHDPSLFHAITLETDIGASRHGTLTTWDLDGWVGGDTHKLWIKSEGDVLNGHAPEHAEYWAMYSRNISEFWDVQAGIRHDSQPESISYAVIGINGLAPYFFETEAHLLISEEGDITARIKQENDFRITQRLITKPYAELNIALQDVEEQEMGQGLTTGELGLQTRYEITRQFAPYVDIRYERIFGETSHIAKQTGEDNSDVIGSVGIRVAF